MAQVFRILVVCTGNICRSAQAEQYIRARLSERFPGLEAVVAVESAGTGAVVGSGMPEEAAALSTRYGGVPDRHIARQLTVEQIREADLVLAMAVEHRSSVVRLLPRVSRNTFTMTEFAALLESAELHPPILPLSFQSLEPADKLRQAVKWAAARRGFLPSENSNHVDIVDPYRRSLKVYEESSLQIVEVLDRTERAAVGLSLRTRL